ncbi:hypothetical protein FK178_06340 [Antarcticibacterium arcticum]|uniref:Uncharacterized protein n=1 Tax=Antarcticibacterium arcticum TaxID=2585771 RepID=A0A5B8YHF9_9FLAO|nr:hypothetical protein [Antarcticibacterium arcticum]QED37360.1 hypothetical protein FK178_06340 [Antarcticibacterium arcticum]
MKTKIYFIVLILSSILTYSCSTEAEIDHRDELEISKTHWKSFKQTNNNSYKYIVRAESWTGTAWVTTITVKDGEISNRHFKYVSSEETIGYVPEEDREWTESYNEINTHATSPTADAITLDEVYLNAENDWLINRRNTTTYFKAENNGLISLCGYVEDNCMDDCFIGIKIQNISPI